MTIKVIHLDSGDFLNLSYGGYGIEQLNEQLKGAIKVDVFQDPNHGTRFVAQWPDEPPAVVPTHTTPNYVHTFVHAHSNWVAIDPVDGTKREYIDEPFLTGDEKRYFGEGQSEILGRAGSTLLGLKQKRQR